MRSITLIVSAFTFAALTGCSHEHRATQTPHDDECRATMGDDVANAARVTGEGVTTGVETGVAGVKQVGRATGGLVTGGTEGAREEWNKGKAETHKEAREGGDAVVATNLPRCTRR